jgi:hypothetical protein
MEELARIDMKKPTVIAQGCYLVDLSRPRKANRPLADSEKQGASGKPDDSKGGNSK